MNINSLRASSIESFDDCQFKYFLNNICNIDSVPNKKALLGTIVHHVLEIIAKTKKTGHYKLKSKINNHSYLLDLCWNKYCKQHEHLFEFEKKDKTFCLQMIENVLQSDYNPLNYKILATEQQFALKINRPGFKDFELRGTMDLIVEIDKDTIGLNDYKTGLRKDWSTGKLKEYEDFLETTQLQVYDLALKALYPQYKYRQLTLYYTQDGGPFTVSFDDNGRNKSISKIRWYYNTIKGTDIAGRLKDDPKKKDQAWKCLYVCQFGKFIQSYRSKDNKEILRTYSYKELKTAPLSLDVRGTEYVKYGRAVSECDQLYRQYTASSESKFIELTSSATKASSRRNDYSHDKISKGVIT